ncbi:hypothetical protein KY311_02830 [Candidatus Woesearchaeota archaeon]|nr:hypothetical protein [Candidatus Woesearchaeota archaeon]
MNEYKWTLKDGSKVKLSFSVNLDNLITKFIDGKAVEGVFLMDCGIARAMPQIMRYCFEAEVNLRERQFIRNLAQASPSTRDRQDIDFYFKMPLRKDAGTVRNVDGRLVIHSSPSDKGEISFNPEDVSQLVEGIIRVLDYDGVRRAQEKCSEVVHYYHQCLDNGFFD